MEWVALVVGFAGLFLVISGSWFGLPLLVVAIVLAIWSDHDEIP